MLLFKMRDKDVKYKIIIIILHFILIYISKSVDHVCIFRTYTITQMAHFHTKMQNCLVCMQ